MGSPATWVPLASLLRAPELWRVRLREGSRAARVAFPVAKVARLLAGPGRRVPFRCPELWRACHYPGFLYRSGCSLCAQVPFWLGLGLVLAALLDLIILLLVQGSWVEP